MSADYYVFCKRSGRRSAHYKCTLLSLLSLLWRLTSVGKQQLLKYAVYLASLNRAVLPLTNGQNRSRPTFHRQPTPRGLWKETRRSLSASASYTLRERLWRNGSKESILRGNRLKGSSASPFGSDALLSHHFTDDNSGLTPSFVCLVSTAGN